MPSALQPCLKTAPVKPWQWIEALQDDPGVSASELRLIGLVRWATYETGGDVRPGDENVAKAIRADVRTVKRIRKSLMAKGYLVLDKPGRGNAHLAAVYHLSVPVRGDTVVTLAIQGDVPDGAKVTNEAGQGDISRGQGDTRVPPPIQGTIQGTDATSPGGGGAAVEKQNRKTPEGPSAPGEDPSAQSSWLGDGDSARDNRAWLAESLGVSAGSVGASLWRWLHDIEREAVAVYEACRCGCRSGCTHDDDCGCICPTSGNAEKCTCECEHDRQYGAYDRAVFQAVKDSREARNPVAYFRAILPEGLTRELRSLHRDA